jgi:ATP-dependent DNA ligase
VVPLPASDQPEQGCPIYPRNGHDWTKRFPLIADGFDIPGERAIFDGQVGRS